MYSITPSTILLTLNALSQTLGPFVADFNHTHVLNPRWPPHARFHNGQTMSIGAFLGALVLYYTWRDSAGMGKADDLRTAALIGSAYYVAGISAYFYPGSAAVDPEFRAKHHTGREFPQFWFFAGFMTLGWVGWWLES